MEVASYAKPTKFKAVTLGNIPRLKVVGLHRRDPHNWIVIDDPIDKPQPHLFSKVELQVNNPK